MFPTPIPSIFSTPQQDTFTPRDERRVDESLATAHDVFEDIGSECFQRLFEPPRAPDDASRCPGRCSYAVERCGRCPKTLPTVLWPKSFMPSYALPVGENLDGGHQVPPLSVGQTFPWNRLDKDLRFVLMRFMLVSSEPITNPWLNNTTFDEDGDVVDTLWQARWNRGASAVRRLACNTITVFRYRDTFGEARTTIRYSWAMWMRPNILATCQQLYNIGSDMLYGHNVFRYTCNVVTTSFSPKLSRHSLLAYEWFTWPRYRDDCARIWELEYLRAHKIRKLIIQFHEIDSDRLASQGYGYKTPKSALKRGEIMILSRHNYTWLDEILWQIEVWGMYLYILTITIDENVPMLGEYIHFLIRTKRAGLLNRTPETPRTFQRPIEEMREMISQRSWRRCFKFGWYSWYLFYVHMELERDPDFEDRFPTYITRISRLVVRGTGPWGNGERAFVPQSMRMMGQGDVPDRILPDWNAEGKVKVTNRIALLITEWFAQTDLVPQGMRIDFTGRFKERWIKDDGNLLDDEEWEKFLREKERERARARRRQMGR